jgi:PilZ domain
MDTQRRKAMRFPLDVPVVFWWMDANGVYQLGEGRSYDVSESGVFVCARACPPAGAQVGLKIPIPEILDAPRALRMEVAGRVLRVEQVRSGEGRDGFAILSDQAILRENDKSN